MQKYITLNCSLVKPVTEQNEDPDLSRSQRQVLEDCGILEAEEEERYWSTLIIAHEDIAYMYDYDGHGVVGIDGERLIVKEQLRHIIKKIIHATRDSKSKKRKRKKSSAKEGRKEQCAGIWNRFSIFVHNTYSGVAYWFGRRCRGIGAACSGRR